MKDDKLYLIHILESTEKILSYTQEGRTVVAKSSLIQDAVVRNFEIIGEAAKKISPALKETTSDIPWKQIAGLRDILIHNYMGINFDEVWRIVEQELPALKLKILSLLNRG